MTISASVITPINIYNMINRPIMIFPELTQKSLLEEIFFYSKMLSTLSCIYFDYISI